jgi:DNA (cytosine-5)-methyltransferase 1
MLRVLKDKKPAAFIGENVKGLVSIHQGEAIKKITGDFEKAGYKVIYRVLNASLYGVPQKRERVFIIGIRNDKKAAFQFPEVLGGLVPLGAVLEDHKSVGDKYYFSNRALQGLKKANKAFNKGRAQPLNAPCNTISTHLAKVSLNGTDPVLLVKKDCYRRLTPREAARVQSFPENFEFVGTDGKKYIQIGNAIPPVLMWHVARAVKSQIFDGRPILKTEAERDNVSDKIEKYLLGERGVFIPSQA